VVNDELMREALGDGCDEAKVGENPVSSGGHPFHSEIRVSLGSAGLGRKLEPWSLYCTRMAVALFCCLALSSIL
jgi:hypothetical protein